MNKELNLAFEILKKVYLDKSYVSIELNKSINSSKNINTALVSKIVYGVLEKDICLEYNLNKFAKKRPSEKIVILLKIVIYVSKEVTGIPSFALVNEIVEIAKKTEKFASGFVNAISKKIINSDLKYPNKSDMVKYLSVRYNYPEWVINELKKTKTMDFIEKLVSFELTTLTHIRVSTNKITPDEFRTKLKSLDIKFEPSLYDYTMYVDYARLLKHDELNKYYIVQGLPSIVTCNVLNANQGKVLDVCSAPGGKAVYLAENSNLDVFACDIYAHRLDLVKKYAQNVGVNMHYCLQDATKFNPAWESKFDYVLCDVPCSNIGVSRKKPDVFMNKSLSDAKTLAGIQLKILENSAKYVKPNGVLQYSTCTILDMENKCVIEKFLQKNSNFLLKDINIDGINIESNNGLNTFYPNMTGTEGFFIGRMVRK